MESTRDHVPNMSKHGAVSYKSTEEQLGQFFSSSLSAQTGQMNQCLCIPTMLFFFSSPCLLFVQPCLCATAKLPDWRIHVSQLRPIRNSASKLRPLKGCGSRSLRGSVSQRTPLHYENKASSSDCVAHQRKHESSCLAKPRRCLAFTRVCLQTQAVRHAHSHSWASAHAHTQAGAHSVLLSSRGDRKGGAHGRAPRTMRYRARWLHA